MQNTNMQQLHKPGLTKCQGNATSSHGQLCAFRQAYGSITAKATSLIFVLFDIALSQDVSFHQLQQLQCLHHCSVVGLVINRKLKVSEDGNDDVNLA